MLRKSSLASGSQSTSLGRSWHGRAAPLSPLCGLGGGAAGHWLIGGQENALGGTEGYNAAVQPSLKPPRPAQSGTSTQEVAQRDMGLSAGRRTPRGGTDGCEWFPCCPPGLKVISDYGHSSARHTIYAVRIIIAMKRVSGDIERRLGLSSLSKQLSDSSSTVDRAPDAVRKLPIGQTAGEDLILSGIPLPINQPEGNPFSSSRHHPHCQHPLCSTTGRARAPIYTQTAANPNTWPGTEVTLVPRAKPKRRERTGSATGPLALGRRRCRPAVSTQGSPSQAQSLPLTPAAASVTFPHISLIHFLFDEWRGHLNSCMSNRKEQTIYLTHFPHNSFSGEFIRSSSCAFWVDIGVVRLGVTDRHSSTGGASHQAALPAAPATIAGPS
ncbi:hypothetical protein AAFF_G00055910 [Aldrovandia affinis]|uniref:Uncharacterized protein n=1 Tax=Aldrovandia affinis TaxID=143900 RepID=A0AAD7S160_9TELE|nr:hypothetical protein AAFF_G00055910 [Aldrovandia affinis]